MLQFFEWYYPADGSLWNQLKKEASSLKERGIDAIWLPPAHKGSKGIQSEGYDSYDLYDLGEFDQKGTVKTKFGTKEELLNAVDACKKAGLNIISDIVLNHLGGADEVETITARKVNSNNRNEYISDPYEIEAYTKFTYPGRKGKYSQFIWDFQCFSGIDYDNKNKENGIFTIQNQYGEGWEDGVSSENGNYDYLMFSDIEFRNPNVVEELNRWGLWLYNTIKFDGMRLDAIKHINPQFFNEWLDFMRKETGKELFTVGEYWDPYNISTLLEYIDATQGRMSLFDAPLHLNLHTASRSGKNYDLTTIFHNSLVNAKPDLAVTIVENHDTQPLQSLEQPVEPWFKGISYSLILLREKGYPCIFYADLYGAKYKDKGGDGNEYEVVIEKCFELELLLQIRKKLSYGTQRDYFDHANCIGWTREGVDEYEKSGCAIVISNSEDGYKKMEIGKKHVGKNFIDAMKKHEEKIAINEDGWAEFKVKAGSVSVWILE